MDCWAGATSRCTNQLFFFFQAEDGIRDYKVTGVQTCALPISDRPLPQSAIIIAGNDLDAVQEFGEPDRRGRQDLAGLIAEGLPLGKELGFPVAACAELALQAEGGAADRAGGHAQGCPKGAVLPKKVPAESDRRAGVRR